MTSLLLNGDPDPNDPGDCPRTWGQGYDPCSYHDLPVHTCLIQSGHDHPCLCMCGAVPHLDLPGVAVQWERWTGWLDECIHDWPTADNAPCVDTNPTRRHMCVDGDPRSEYGHDRNYHTCRCGARTHTPHGQRRAQRDAQRS